MAAKGKLSGHRAVVTGASSGIGEAFARILAADGADLVIVARRRDRLEKLAQELSQKHGVKVDCVEADLSRPESFQKLFEQATREPVTMLINNAGIGQYGPFLTTPFEKHTNTLVLNAQAVTDLSYRFARHMLEHGRDAYICNVASIAAYAPAPNFAVYSGTKHYVRVFSEVLNIELKGTRVSVTCLCPGGTLTEFMETNGQKLKPGASIFMMTSETVARIGLKATLKRKGVKVTGFINVLATTLPRLVPGWLGIRAAHLAMKGNVELADPSAKHLPGAKN